MRSNRSRAETTRATSKTDCFLGAKSSLSILFVSFKPLSICTPSYLSEKGLNIVLVV